MDYLEQIDYNIIETSEETISFAKKFIDFGFLKRKSYDDCRHIAAAILASCDFIISWNFKHIVDLKTAKGIKVITTLEGYKDLIVYPPSAILEGSNIIEIITGNLEISERFDLDDIRKIREYNAVRYENMIPAEIVADTKAGAAEVLEIIKIENYGRIDDLKRTETDRLCKKLCLNVTFCYQNSINNRNIIGLFKPDRVQYY